MTNRNFYLGLLVILSWVITVTVVMEHEFLMNYLDVYEYTLAFFLCIVGSVVLTTSLSIEEEES